MSELHRLADIGMCCFYIATEFLCLYGIKKYKKAILPPWSQLVIAPFEFAVVLFYIVRHATINYSFFSYLAWAVIEICIVRYYYKFNCISERMKKWYIPLLGIHSAFLLFIILKTNSAFAFFGVFNTLIAIVIWYIFIFKPSYPITPFTLIVFVFKFLADAIGCIPYISTASTLSIINSIILIMMVIVDICFFPTWFILYRQRQNVLQIEYKKQEKAVSQKKLKKPKQTVSQKKYSKQWQSTKKKYKKK